jgi:anaerobic dimethyl sulfoxide reductase subunit A
MKAANNGTKFIIIDPIMTDTVVGTQAEWVPINGGTDVALLAAMAHVMVKENLYDKDFMATHAVGFDEDTLPSGAPANSSWMSYIMGRGPDGGKDPRMGCSDYWHTRRAYCQSRS